MRYLDNTFSVEHIPFSSNCDFEIDLDRTGNLLPIFSDLNSGRSNKSIKYFTEDYKHKEFCGFFKIYYLITKIMIVLLLMTVGNQRL